MKETFEKKKRKENTSHIVLGPTLLILFSLPL